MKLTKFAKLVKESLFCDVIENYETGIWLSNGHAVYKASELPHMDDILQVYAILDISPKKKKTPLVNITQIGSDTKYGKHNLSDYPEGDDSEQEAEELKIQASYMGQVFNVLFGEDKELVFYNAKYLAPIIDRVQEGYVRYFIRGEGEDKYIAVKDGFQLIATIMPVKFLNEDYLADLQDYQLACQDQFFKDREREKEKQYKDTADLFGNVPEQTGEDKTDPQNGEGC